MFCKKCGTKIKEGHNFCPNCGLKIENMYQQTEHFNQQQPYSKGSYHYEIPTQPTENHWNYNQNYAYQNGGVRPFSFGEAIKNFFAGYVDFDGRATRMEFWFSQLFQFVIGMIAGILYSVLYIGGMTLLAEAVYAVVLLFTLFILLPAISVSVRRLHDTGRSGFWIFITFVPLFGTIVFFLFMCLDSDLDNRYGRRKQ